MFSPKHHFTTTSKYTTTSMTSRYFQNVAVLANYMQREGCIPFEVTTKTKPNTETVAALLEARTLMNNPQSKTYSKVFFCPFSCLTQQSAKQFAVAFFFPVPSKNVFYFEDVPKYVYK